MKIDFNGIARVDAEGFKGWIWLFWRDHDVDIKVIDIDDQVVTMEVHKLGVQPWLFLVIHSSPYDNLCRQL